MDRSLKALLTLLVASASCGDPMLDEWAEPEFLFVIPPQWSTLYAPGLDVVTAFPELADVDSPRLESSAPNVVDVRVLSQPIDEPRFRAARMRTRQEGEAEISLWDGTSLIRSEVIRVRQPASLELVLQPPERLPAWAFDAETPVQLLELGRAPAKLRFVDDVGEEMVAAGRAEFLLGVQLDDRTTHVSVRDPVEDRTLARAFDQLNAGDVVTVGSPPRGGSSVIRLGLPEVGGVPSDLSGNFNFAPPFWIDGLETRVRYQPGPGGQESAWVVVYGRSSRFPGTRVLGLNPVVTVDGGGRRRIEQDARYPWIFQVELVETEGGILEIRWRDLLETIDLEVRE